MANRTCSIEGCGHSHLSPEEIIEERTERSGSCLVWLGSRNEYGYARPRIEGVKVYAHRWAWEQEHGPIPAGMDVDHICHNRACVNTRHLRLASRAQNAANRRGANTESRTGFRNVRKHGSGYQAYVHSQGEQHRSTVFPTIEEAAYAAEKLRAELFGEFAGRG